MMTKRTRRSAYLFLLLTMAAVSTITVYAISWDEMKRRAAQTKKDTALGVLTPQEERAQISADWDEMRREQTAAGVPIMGQAIVSGQYPAVFLSPGSQAVLQFVFVSTDTGMPVPGPEVGYVVYQVSLDPDFPDALDWVGVSSDPAARFAFPVNVQGFEPSYFATPFDRAGRPIIINGLDGNNVAVGMGTVIFPDTAPSHLNGHAKQKTSLAQTPISQSPYANSSRHSPRILRVSPAGK